MLVGDPCRQQCSREFYPTTCSILPLKKLRREHTTSRFWSLVPYTTPLLPRMSAQFGEKMLILYSYSQKFSTNMITTKKYSYERASDNNWKSRIASLCNTPVNKTNNIWRRTAAISHVIIPLTEDCDWDRLSILQILLNSFICYFYPLPASQWKHAEQAGLAWRQQSYAS